MTLDVIAGKVSILVNSLESRDHFLAHTKQLTILNAKMTNDKGADLDMLEVFEHKENEFLVFKAAREVPKGNYTMHIGTNGFYTISNSNSIFSNVIAPISILNDCCCGFTQIL